MKKTSRNNFKNLTTITFSIGIALLATTVVVATMKNKNFFDIFKPNSSGKNQLQSNWGLDKITNYNNSEETNISNPLLYTLFIGSSEERKNHRFNQYQNVVGIKGYENCNSFIGSYSIQDMNITFKNISSTESTEIACSTEIDYTNLLNNKTYQYTIESSDESWESKTLILTNDNHKMVFSEIIYGRIKYIDLEGGFYGINTLKDNKPLFVDNIPQEKLEYNYNYNISSICLMYCLRKNDYATIYQWGETCFIENYSFEPEIVYGRPLINSQGEQLTTSIICVEKSEWEYPMSKNVTAEIKNWSKEKKDIFVEHWLRVAQLEHSSIYSFKQVIAELKYYNFSPKIIEQAKQAMLDEEKHTKIALSLANLANNNVKQKYSLIPWKPTFVIRTLDEFMKANYKDACLGEAASAKALFEEAKMYRQNGSPHLASLLEEIAEDETRHAELGFIIDNNNNNSNNNSNKISI